MSLMSAILKFSRHNEQQEIEFELHYLTSLSTKQRFEMMIRKSKEMITLLEQNGHRRTSEIIKRT